MTNSNLSSSNLAALSETEPERGLSLSALRDGDVDAIGACYRAHAQALIAVAYRLTASKDDAQDIDCLRRSRDTKSAVNFAHGWRELRRASRLCIVEGSVAGIRRQSS